MYMFTYVQEMDVNDHSDRDKENETLKIDEHGINFFLILHL